MTQNVLGQPLAGKQPVATAIYVGKTLGLQGDVLHGWALDQAQPEQRLLVEIFIDGIHVAVARADQYEPAASLGDLFHGFAVQLNETFISEARTISAKVANHDFQLDGEIELPTPPSKDTAEITSQVWHTGGLRVGGWSWDPKAPDRHVSIHISENGKSIANVICNAHCQALAYRNSTDHGFSFDLPWTLADGEVHIITIENDIGQPLSGSPIRVCCLPEGLEGLVQKLKVENHNGILPLVEILAKENTLRLPQSAGWRYYSEWYEAFQQLQPYGAMPTIGKIGILLISDGNTTLEKISTDSLSGYPTDSYTIAVSAKKDLAPAITLLLEAHCDRLLPVKAGDRLAAHSLPYFNSLLSDGSAWGFSDCDLDDEKGARTFPWFKPVWDLDLFIGADVYSAGAIFGRDIVEQALKTISLNSNFEHVDFHLLLAGIALVTHRTSALVTHMTHVMYHRADGSATSPELDIPSNSRRQAVQWLCSQLADGTIVKSIAEYPALLRAQWPLPEKLPRVSLIVPTRDQYKLLHKCIEGLLKETDYPNLQVIVVDNQSTDKQTLSYLAQLAERGVDLIAHPHPFNYSTINNIAASHAKGMIIGLVNNDIEIIDSCWLKEMVAQLIRPGVGAVGAKLMWPNRMVQHSGVVVGINGLAAHTGNDCLQDDPGYLGFNQISRRQSAVTAACMLVKKDIFELVGGLDEIAFPVAFNDVDLCLKIQKEGMHIVWTAFAKLIHAESASRGKDQTPEKKARGRREQEIFINRWSSLGQCDPYYHPSLSQDYLSGPYGGLMIPARKAIKRKPLIK